MTRLRHLDKEGSPRFVTFSCYRRLPSLKNDRAKRILIGFLDSVRKKHGFRILGYCIMPEHVHLVLMPFDDMKLGLVVREIKSLSARQFFSEFPAGRPGDTRVFWERRCYDHNCRSRGEVRAAIEYCHRNPMRRGLVAEMSAWRWSSYNWYQGATDVPIAMDVMEL